MGKNKISGNVQTKQGKSVVCETMSAYVKYCTSVCMCTCRGKVGKTLDPIVV